MKVRRVTAELARRAQTHTAHRSVAWHDGHVGTAPARLVVHLGEQARSGGFQYVFIAGDRTRSTAQHLVEDTAQEGMPRLGPERVVGDPLHVRVPEFGRLLTGQESLLANHHGGATERVEGRPANDIQVQVEATERVHHGNAKEIGALEPTSGSRRKSVATGGGCV